MSLRYIPFLLFSLFLTTAASSATFTIVDSGLSFSPTPLTINVGDTVNFSLATMHNAIEVSQTTWNNNGNTSNGGFSLPFGGGQVIFTVAGTYYYVCAPHASSGMKGMINVVLTSVSTGSIAPTTYCRGGSISIPFTATGAFSAQNIFTAQLSDASGNFASPTNIGTLAGTTSGQISAVIPTGAPLGSGYRVRVASSNPQLIGNNNGADLTILDAVSAMITPAGPTTFCDGQDVTLNANTGTGFTYVWKRNGTPIPGAGAPSYVASLAGLYSVEVSNGPCSATAAAVRVTIIPANPTTLTWTGGVSTDWTVLGNWDNPCATPTPGDTVIVPSSTTPPTNIPAIALNRLLIDNSAGITLTNDLQLNGPLVLTNGNITLGSAHLMLAANASISGGGASSFIVTDGAGELRQAGVGSGGRSGAVLFPVGPAGGSYTPLQLTNSSSQDEFRVRVRSEVLDGGTTGSALSMDVVGLTWHLSEASPGGSNATITFQWDTGNELTSFDRSACYVAHHDGADWVPLQSIGPATGSPPYQRSVSGVTSFSPFAIGDGESPLPVSYRTLSADVLGDAVYLRWETEHELNSSGFDVERASSESNDWITMSFIPSAAAPGAGTAYEYLDRPPAPGDWRYRLRQIDMDGSVEYSQVLNVHFDAFPTGLAIESVYPNPMHSSSSDAALSFTAAVAGQATVALHDMLGRKIASVFNGTVGASQRYIVRFDASAFSPGTYIVRLSQGGQTVSTRVIIRR